MDYIILLTVYSERFRWLNMFNAFIAFLSTFLLGVVIYAKIWWDGSGVGWKFTKWFFGLFFIAALIVGGVTYVAG